MTHLTSYLEKYLANQLRFGDSLPSDPEMKLLDFEKNYPGIRVGVRAPHFDLQCNRSMIFELL